MSTVFYVYAYLRSKDSRTAKMNSPYYIGKGKGNRAYSKHKRTLVPKDISKIVFLESNLTELGAFALERRYIRWYGRKDLGTGILINLTDGGEGVSGYVPTQEARAAISSKVSVARKGMKFTEEHKKNISLAQKGRKPSEETIIKITQSRKRNGVKYSEETLEKYRRPKSENHKANMRKPKSPEHIANMSKVKKGKIYTRNEKGDILVTTKEDPKFVSGEYVTFKTHMCYVLDPVTNTEIWCKVRDAKRENLTIVRLC